MPFGRSSQEQAVEYGFRYTRILARRFIPVPTTRGPSFTRLVSCHWSYRDLRAVTSDSRGPISQSCGKTEAGERYPLRAASSFMPRIAMNARTLEALSRTLLLLRDHVRHDISDELIGESLLGTRVALIGDRRNMEFESAQHALV